MFCYCQVVQFDLQLHFITNIFKKWSAEYHSSYENCALEPCKSNLTQIINNTASMFIHSFSIFEIQYNFKFSGVKQHSSFDQFFCPEFEHSLFSYNSYVHKVLCLFVWASWFVFGYFQEIYEYQLCLVNRGKMTKSSRRTFLGVLSITDFEVLALPRSSPTAWGAEVCK